MSADESKPPSRAAGEIESSGGSAPERKAETPAWVSEDPFPPRRDPAPAPVAEPERSSAPATTERPAPESPRPATRPTPAEKVVVDPALRAPPPASSASAPRSAEGPRDPEPRRATPREPVAPDDLLPAPHRFLGLPVWGWLLAAVAVLGLLFLLADLRNRNRYTIVCNAHKVELHQGKRFPWPFGLEPIGGPEYAPVAIPAEADCRARSFATEEEAAKAFLDLILAQVRAALANPGASNLKQARAQLAQAMLLTRTYRARRKEAKGMLADLSYREGRASLARAENELRIALARFQEAQKLESARFEDLDDWIAHLEALLRTISPSPFSGGGGVLSAPPSAAPGFQRPPSASQPARPLLPPRDGGALPPPPGDAGPPGAGGGILM